MVSGRLHPGYDYLVCRKLSSLWHELTGSSLEPDLNQFIAAALELGFTQRVASAIGSQIIARLLIQTGRHLRDETAEEGRAFNKGGKKRRKGARSSPPATESNE